MTLKKDDLSTWNSQNFLFDWFLLWKVYNIWPKNSAEGLSFMTLKSDAKFEEELTGALKNGTRNLANFYQKTQKSQNWDFDGVLLSKVENVWAWQWRKNAWEWQWRMIQNLKRNWLAALKLTRKFDKFWPKHSNVSKICTLMRSFSPKYIIFELKKYRRVMFDSTENWCKIWRETDLCFEKWHEEFGKFLQAEKWRFHLRN